MELGKTAAVKDTTKRHKAGVALNRGGKDALTINVVVQVAL